MKNCVHPRDRIIASLKPLILLLLTGIMVTQTGWAVGEEKPADLARSKPIPNKNLAPRPAWVDGEVKKIDLEKERIVLVHDAVPGGMPAMIMGFRFDNPKRMRSLSPGQKVRFIYAEKNGELVLLEIEVR